MGGIDMKEGRSWPSPFYLKSSGSSSHLRIIGKRCGKEQAASTVASRSESGKKGGAFEEKVMRFSHQLDRGERKENNAKEGKKETNS